MGDELKGARAFGHRDRRAIAPLPQRHRDGSGTGEGGTDDGWTRGRVERKEAEVAALLHASPGQVGSDVSDDVVHHFRWRRAVLVEPRCEFFHGSSLRRSAAGEINRSADLSLLWGVDQVVLEGEQGSPCPGVDADLAVEVEDVRANGRLGDEQLTRDLLVREAAGDGLQHIDLTVGETGWPRPAHLSGGPRLTGRHQHSLKGPAVETAGGDLIAQLSRRLRRRQRRSPSTLLAHRLVDLRDGEDSSA